MIEKIDNFKKQIDKIKAEKNKMMDEWEEERV